MTGSPLVMRQVVSLALLGCHLSACSTWRMVTVPPEQAIAGRPEQLRVTRADGDVVVLIKPEIVQDSLKGKRAATASLDSNALAFPLSDVRSVALLKRDPTKTTFLVAGMALAAVLTLITATYEPPFNTAN